MTGDQAERTAGHHEHAKSGHEQHAALPQAAQTQLQQQLVALALALPLWRVVVLLVAGLGCCRCMRRHQMQRRVLLTGRVRGWWLASRSSLSGEFRCCGLWRALFVCWWKSIQHSDGVSRCVVF